MDSNFDLSSAFIGEYPNSMDVQLVENVDLAHGFRMTVDGVLVNDADIDMNKGIIAIPDRYMGQSVDVEYSVNPYPKREGLMFQSLVKEWASYNTKSTPHKKKKKSTIHKPCRCGSGLNFNHCCNRKGSR